jgi:hypothetical protein
MQKPCVKPDTGQHPSNLGRWHVEQQAASGMGGKGGGRALTLGLRKRVSMCLFSTCLMTARTPLFGHLLHITHDASGSWSRPAQQPFSDHNRRPSVSRPEALQTHTHFWLGDIPCIP